MILNPARGQDCSWYQLPSKMRYGEWAVLYSMCFGFGRVALGKQRDWSGALHTAGMRAAGYLTAPYLALKEEDSPIEQAKILIGERHPDDRLPGMLDAERGNLTERTIRGFCDYYDANTSAGLLLYINFPGWTGYMRGLAEAIIRRYLAYECVCAAYPFDSPDTDAQGRFQPQPMDPVSVALRSNPPQNRNLITPAPWAKAWSQQHTGHGTLKGYDGFLDLQVHMTLTAPQLRARYAGGPIITPPPPPPATGLTDAERTEILALERLARGGADRLRTLGG